MRSLSDFPRKNRVLIVAGIVFIALGVAGAFRAYFTTAWWFQFMNGISVLAHRLAPVALIALAVFIVWAVHTGRLRNLFKGGGDGVVSRSRTDCKILGVCGGIAQHYQVDSTVIRTIVLLLFVAFPLLTTLVYFLVGAFVQPE